MLRRTCALGVVPTVTVSFATEVARPQSAPEELLAGDTKMDTIQSYKGNPLPKPDRILVYEFSVPGDVFTMDESVAARICRLPHNP